MQSEGQASTRRRVFPEQYRSQMSGARLSHDDPFPLRRGQVVKTGGTPPMLGSTAMGMFRYGDILRAEFEDRTLWHLQWVIGAKICRGESLHFSWKDDVGLGSGRTTVWIHPNCSLVYNFHSGHRAPLNGAWLKDLMSTANSNSGLYVTPEPAHLDTELRDLQSRTDTPQS